MKTRFPKDGDTKQATSSRSPELQKRLDEFHRKIGKALCENLNRSVLAQAESDLQLISQGQAPEKP